jgi:hypothetical protein
MKQSGGKFMLLLVVGLFTCVVALLWIKFLRVDESQLFRRLVLDPIPASVSNIRADQPQTLGGYGYTFRFTIDKADLALIISAHTLAPVYNARYDADVGYLAFDWGPTPTDGIYMPVYPPTGKRQPSWFVPGAWPRAEVYAVCKVQGRQDDTRVLLYDERSGEAYFLTFSRRN